MKYNSQNSENWCLTTLRSVCCRSARLRLATWWMIFSHVCPRVSVSEIVYFYELFSGWLSGLLVNRSFMCSSPALHITHRTGTEAGYRGMKLQRNLFSFTAFAVILNSLATAGVCNWPHFQYRPYGDVRKLINLASSSINFRYFVRHISTFWPANTVRTDCVLHWRRRKFRPYSVSSARNIVSKCYFCVQIWHVSKVCFVLKLVVSGLGQIFQNSLESRLNSPGWEKTTPLNVQESLFGKLPIHWTNLNVNSWSSYSKVQCYLRLSWYGVDI